jgi:hypothetical protein
LSHSYVAALESQSKEPQFRNDDLDPKQDDKILDDEEDDDFNGSKK